MEQMLRTIKLLGNWSANRVMGRRRPLVAVFSLTHYCNFFCPMCPFGDGDKIYVIGGGPQPDDSVVNVNEIFNVGSGRWIPVYFLSSV